MSRTSRIIDANIWWGNYHVTTALEFTGNTLEYTFLWILSRIKVLSLSEVNRKTILVSKEESDQFKTF